MEFNDEVESRIPQPNKHSTKETNYLTIWEYLGISLDKYEKRNKCAVSHCKNRRDGVDVLCYNHRIDFNSKFLSNLDIPIKQSKFSLSNFKERIKHVNIFKILSFRN